MNNLAPISVMVYDRLEHFKKCIGSLTKNPEAKNSILYIFSDGARIGDEAKISSVRDYIATLDGFKDIRVFFQEKNDHEKNAHDLEFIPIDSHGKAIILEDDNVVSPFFLEYMNYALNFFQNDDQILGISGYAPPLGQNNFTPSDVYLSYFYSGWGHATWSHKPYFEFLNRDKPYEDMIRSGIREKVKRIHPKLHLALKRMDDGMHKGGDQKLSYYMIKHGLYQIKPVISLVKNIGHDGSGVHCGASERFNQDPYEGRLDVCLKTREYMPQIDKMQYEYFHPRRTLAARILKKILRVINR
jgi:hypothetical protein